MFLYHNFQVIPIHFTVISRKCAFLKMNDVIKLCDKLEILKRQIKVIFMCKY